MSVRSSSSNPESGKRIKKLLKKNKITQSNFAAQIPISEKHLSQIVTGRRNLTRDIAERIASLFPGVRAEWLLCLDNWETEAEVQAAQDEIANTAWVETEALDAFAGLSGYVFKLNIRNRTETLLIDGESVPVATCSHNAWNIYNNGKLVATCTLAELEAISAEIAEFTEFKIKKLCERKRGNNG